jgi:hypothetical protein
MTGAAPTGRPPPKATGAGDDMRRIRGEAEGAAGAPIATRSTKMYLLQEDLARAHIRKLQDEAAAERVARGLVRVRKAVRKADRARLYAWRALASAISYD